MAIRTSLLYHIYQSAREKKKPKKKFTELSRMPYITKLALSDMNSLTVFMHSRIAESLKTKFSIFSKNVKSSKILHFSKMFRTLKSGTAAEPDFFILNNEHSLDFSKNCSRTLYSGTFWPVVRFWLFWSGKHVCPTQAARRFQNEERVLRTKCQVFKNCALF